MKSRLPFMVRQLQERLNECIAAKAALGEQPPTESMVCKSKEDESASSHFAYSVGCCCISPEDLPRYLGQEAGGWVIRFESQKDLVLL